MRRAAKTDRNHTEIIKAFRGLGFSVFSTHQVGQGFPDLVVASPIDGQNWLVEVKDGTLPPSKRKLTKDETNFENNWLGSYVVIESVDDVIRFHEMLVSA